MPAVTERTDYGYRSVFTDPVTMEDVIAWSESVRRAVGERTSFGQIIDLRGRARLSGSREEEAIIQESMRFVKEHGLTRSAVIVSAGAVTLKIKQLAFGTSVYEWERYIDGANPRCEQIALDWVERGIDPDSPAG
ncbi:MAG: hypothetical protein ACYDIE_11110 [Candidatus Krumholzibacteriia bacterium]